MAKKATTFGCGKRLENRVKAAEQHIRDLEVANEAQQEVFKKNNLLARVEALEKKLTSR